MLKHIARRLSRDQKGFTLIELLVVVAIIALLATFAAPKLFEAINKSKKAPGQADMQTISSALERHYMDNSKYALTQADLTNGYLKASTTFVNGYKQPYLYGTTASGSGYVLIDAQGITTDADGAALLQQIRVMCNGNPYDFTIPAAPSGLVIRTNILDADINSCSASAVGTTAGISVVTH